MTFHSFNSKKETSNYYYFSFGKVTENKAFKTIDNFKFEAKVGEGGFCE